MSQDSNWTYIKNFMIFGKVAIPSTTLKWEEFWIQVTDYWLEISKKVGQPSFFTIPLDIEEIKSAFQQTGIQNSIEIETTKHAGSIKLFISSTNRLDIINLYNSINVGRQNYINAFSFHQKNPSEQSIQLDLEGVSGFLSFGKTNYQMSINSKLIEIQGPKVNLAYPLNNIISMSAKQNDSSCSTRLCISLDDGNNITTKEFVCNNHVLLLKVISVFLFNTQNRDSPEAVSFPSV